MSNGQRTAQESGDRLVLRQSKPSSWATLASFGFAALSVSGIVRHDAEALAWSGAILFGAIALLLLMLRYWRPGFLALTPEGFSKVGILESTSHRWSDVTPFKVASPGYVYPRRLPKQVIFQCLPSSSLSPGETRVLGAYGDMKPEELAGLMNPWRSRLR